MPNVTVVKKDAFVVAAVSAVAAAQQQMHSELNEGGGVAKDETKIMLLQKYGFADPVLTASEQNLIRREEKRHARSAA